MSNETTSAIDFYETPPMQYKDTQLDSVSEGITKNAPIITPIWYPKFEKELDIIFDLKEGWNGANTFPVSKNLRETIVTAITDAPCFLNKPSIVPLFDGSIQIEWQHNGKDLEIEISKQNQVSILLETPDGDTEEHLNKTLNDIKDFINKFSAR